MTSHRSELFLATGIAAVSFAFPAGAALAVASQTPASATAPAVNAPASSVRAGPGRPVELTLWRGEGVGCSSGPDRYSQSRRPGVVVSGGHGECFRLRSRVMTMDRVRAATAGPERGGQGWQVYLTFDDAQRREFTAVTAAAVGRQLAVLDNGVLISAPMVTDRIDTGILEIVGLRESQALRLARGLTDPDRGTTFSARPVAGDD